MWEHLRLVVLGTVLVVSEDDQKSNVRGPELGFQVPYPLLVRMFGAQFYFWCVLHPLDVVFAQNGGKLLHRTRRGARAPGHLALGDSHDPSCDRFIHHIGTRASTMAQLPWNCVYTCELCAWQ